MRLETYNAIVQTFVAVGTIGATCVALWQGRIGAIPKIELHVGMMKSKIDGQVPVARLIARNVRPTPLDFVTFAFAGKDISRQDSNFSPVQDLRNKGSHVIEYFTMSELFFCLDKKLPPNHMGELYFSCRCTGLRNDTFREPIPKWLRDELKKMLTEEEERKKETLKMCADMRKKAGRPHPQPADQNFHCPQNPGERGASG